MTDPDYDAEFPYQPGAIIEDYRGIEKLRAIEDPELRKRVISAHEAGAYGPPAPKIRSKEDWHAQYPDTKQRAAGERL